MQIQPYSKTPNQRQTRPNFKGLIVGHTENIKEFLDINIFLSSHTPDLMETKANHTQSEFKGLFAIAFDTLCGKTSPAEQTIIQRLTQQGIKFKHIPFYPVVPDNIRVFDHIQCKRAIYLAMRRVKYS